MSDDYERVKTWCNDPRKMPCAPYNSICRVFEDYDRLRAELADVRADRDRYSDLLDVSQGCVRELRRLLDEARKQEPVAWHWTRPDGEPENDDAFVGKPTEFAVALVKRDGHGVRYLYAAPVPEQPAAVPAEVARAVQILRKHNEWRRGADNNHWQATPYSPAELGRAIDMVCDATHDIQHDVLKRATQYAHDIVTWLHRDHYADNTKFEPFGDLLGLLSQIDNMICGWKEPHPAVPDDEAKDAETKAYKNALDAALAFIGDVAPGASWWDDVWAEHERAILSATEGRSNG